MTLDELYLNKGRITTNLQILDEELKRIDIAIRQELKNADKKPIEPNDNKKS